MKYIILQKKQSSIKYSRHIFYIIKIKKGGLPMVKFLAKIAEKYAKSTNTACFVYSFLHQPKMPASLIKKD